MPRTATKTTPIASPLTDFDEATLIQQAKQGQRAAFTAIMERYQGPIYNLCYRMLGNRTEAEDAAQETFLRAYLKLHRYDDGRKFSTWLFSIASHYCIDRLRTRRITWVAWDDLAGWYDAPQSTTPQPEAALLNQEYDEAVQKLLHTLPPPYRNAVILKYWYNLPYEEIAQAMDTTVSAIKGRLFRAKKMMLKASQQPYAASPHFELSPALN